jgi:hypothetical protein
MALCCACALLAGAALAPPPALADGDPASDVLASQPLFLPADGGFRQADAAQLSGLLAGARRAGVAIRVALIAAPADLGSVGALWRRPQAYARFLGQELSQVYRGTVVVVMPNGVGVYVTTKPGGAPATINAPRGSEIATGVIAVQALANDAGHLLALPAAAAQPGSASPLGSVDLASWLALAAGAALIAAAWTASLRARPARRLRRAG